MDTTQTTTTRFEILDQPSRSKGWARYRANVGGRPVVQSSTGNEWVSASHDGKVEDGAVINLEIDIENRTKSGKKTRQGQTYRLVARDGATAEIRCEPRGIAQGLTLRVHGAALAE